MNVRRTARWLLLLALVVVLAAAGFGYLYRRPLARQWACYRLGQADTLDEARRQLDWFLEGPDAADRLAVLVQKWDTGNQRFDLYLAHFVAEPQGSPALREAFARRLNRRPDLVPRWAHYWAFRAEPSARAEVDLVLQHADTLANQPQPRPLSWREVLDLAAVFTLTGDRKRAEGLEPGNWSEHYRVWRETHAGQPGQIEQPKHPLPDWQGAVPDWARGRVAVRPRATTVCGSRRS